MRVRRFQFKAIFLAFLILVMEIAFPSPEGTPASNRLILATTTSVQDSGLLNVLLPSFERERGVRVDVIAVGTGQALALARRGDADVVLVHAPRLEREFVESGYGVRRTCIAYTTFTIVGPADDPAQIRTAKDAVAAFVRIARRRALFISRGDGSGTEIKEWEIWKKAGINPKGQAWYLASGGGMGTTLIMASEKRAYTLTDLPTYLAMQPRIRLALLYPPNDARDPMLLNQYSIIATNPSKFPKVNFADAVALIHYLRSPAVQRRIAEYGQDRFSRPPFTPLHGRCLQ